MIKYIVKTDLIVRGAFSLLTVHSLLFAPGCATAPRTDESGVKDVKPLEVTSALRFPDLPVPEGFKLITRESFVFENDYIRFGLLKYTGRPTAERVIKFYKEQMSVYGWEPVNVIEYGTRLLNFEKPDQTCVITIESSVTSTSLTIAVTPRANISRFSERKKRLDKE